MDNLTLQKIKELIGKNENIGIAVGKNPTLDEMGAGLALYLSLTDSGKKVAIASPTSPIVELSSLVGIDKVRNSFGVDKGGDLAVSFPYKEGEIEKISYTLENGFLNILVKAGEQGLSFNEKDIQYKRGGKAPQAVFVIGTPRLSDLGDLYNPEALKDTIVVNVDNKESNQGFGDIVVVSKQFSSVSEEIASLIVSMGITMDVDIAQNLLSGICNATDNFQNPRTSPLAFEMVGVLLKKGARRNGFNQSTKVKFVEEGNLLQRKEIKKEEKNPPDDWLAPKIYKGSTSV